MEPFARLYRNAVLTGIAWTFLITGSLLWNIGESQQQTQALAITAARAHFNKDQAFRLWATRHGGVYVPADEKTPPNPHLEHIPLRDIGASGKSLTLMNPAYMLRQVMEEYEALYGIKGHITSLKPLRPENSPDTWERLALARFEQGLGEMVEFTEIEGEEYLRLMRPMVTAKGCLKCHGHQGYAEGDVRGGVSVSLPMSTYLALERDMKRSLVGWHGMIWALGLGALGLAMERSRRLTMRRLQAEVALRESHDHLEEEVERRTMDLRETNDRLRSEMIERKRMEKELISLERLRALGDLSAGFCHHFYNILTGILGPAQLQKRLAKDPQILQETEAIITAATRAEDLVHRLAQAVRDEPEGGMQPVSINQVLRQAIRATQPIWKDRAESRGVPIEIAVDLEEVPDISGTPLELNEILRDLLDNAVDAMPEGGCITFRTQAVGNEVQLTVSDTGVGMDEATRQRVFEPFFSTKMNVGTGLSLSMVYGTIRRWKGSIQVDSAPGSGTTFSLRFPFWEG